MNNISTAGSKEDIVKIVQLIAEKVEGLVSRTIGRDLPITYITIFGNHPHQYNRFVEWASELGTKSEANNGVRFELKEPIQTAGGLVKSIRIREPDVYRSQIGCADVKAGDYSKFKSEELPKHPESLRLIERPEYDMIEFFDFNDNDVLAYVLSNQ
jgi:hypothetical protein